MKRKRILWKVSKRGKWWEGERAVKMKSVSRRIELGSSFCTHENEWKRV